MQLTYQNLSFKPATVGELKTVKLEIATAWTAPVQPAAALALFLLAFASSEVPR